jgi:hypothetical protein
MRLFVSIIVLISTIIGVQTVRGFNAWTYGGTVLVWPDNQLVRYLYPSSFSEGTEPFDLLLYSMSEWNSIDGSSFEYFYYPLDQDYTMDHYDGYSDTTAVAASELDYGVLGLTYSVNNQDVWYDMDMVFSDFPLGVGWNFELQPTCEIEAIPAEYGFTFVLTTLHECGHSIGLAHEPTGDEPQGDPWMVCSMNPAYPHGGSNGVARAIETHSDDRNGARYLYPTTLQNTTDLAALNFSWHEEYVGVAFTVNFEPLNIYPSDPLSVRSAIENLGTTDVTGVIQNFYLSTDDVISPDDVVLAEIGWDIPWGGLYDFDVIVDMPGDLPWGEYRIMSLLDVFNQVDEVWEDNNDVTYCLPLTVEQLVPVIVEPLGQHIIQEGEPWVSPVSQVTHPLNMATVTWSLESNPPEGLVINPQTGQLSWESPVYSEFQYVIYVRAENSAGSDTSIMYIGVEEGEVCHADLNSDGVVSTNDLLIMIAWWGEPNPDIDIDGSGVVDTGDILLLLSAFGPCV